jgi:alpha-beta hydrolase superfamily lysophospholipase
VKILRALRGVFRLVRYAAVFALGGLLVLVLGDVLYSSGLRDLRPWETAELANEFRAGMPNAPRSFAEYMALEDRLFAEVKALERRDYDARLDASLSRYNPADSMLAARLKRDWNRSYVLEAQPARAVALLVHGLSDSPYSLRSVALALQAEGVTVYGLRLPGHGTIPAGLDRVRWQDWMAATEMAFDDIRARQPSLPLYFVGYSTGAALGLNYAADAIEHGHDERLPKRMFLISPAVGVAPVAMLANLQRLVTDFGIAPKSRWTNVDVEVDPYKYGSFAKNAGAQVYYLTTVLAARLQALERSGLSARLPPITSFQSVVDDTVSSDAVVSRLYGGLRDGMSELVLFDVNRLEGLRPFLEFSPKPILDATRRGPRSDYRLTLITNANPESSDVVERIWAPDAQAPETRPLPYAWPQGIYSLSHVALPFAPDDPVYGLQVQGPAGPLRTLGNLELRGERNVMVVPAAERLRLRSNPFHAYLLGRITARIDEDLKAVASRAQRGTQGRPIASQTARLLPSPWPKARNIGPMSVSAPMYSDPE